MDNKKTHIWIFNALCASPKNLIIWISSEKKRVTKHLANKYIKTKKLYYLAFKVHSSAEFCEKKPANTQRTPAHFVYLKNHNNIQILIYFNEMALMRQTSCKMKFWTRFFFVCDLCAFVWVRERLYSRCSFVRSAVWLCVGNGTKVVHCLIENVSLYLVRTIPIFFSVALCLNDKSKWRRANAFPLPK